VLSPELSLPQIRDINDGLAIVYGKIPLMLLERCFIKENFGCEKCGKCSLVDRKSMKFPLLREYGHRNLLLNSVESYMGDKKPLLAQYNVRGEHFIFSTETPKRCAEIISAYKNGESIFENPKRILK
jgi:collagenase-like PrtC family protease